MARKIKESSDKRMKRWQRLQNKDKQQKQREAQLDEWFYRLYYGKPTLNRRA